MNEELLKKARDHDPDAFTELIQSQMNGMYRTAYAILMNDADAADAVHDTILTLWEKIGSLRKPQYFKTWYTRILMNRCFDIRKRRASETGLEHMREPAGEDRSTLEWKEALSRLDEKYRIPLELYYGQGYRTSEIAKLLHIPGSTVRTRLARGRESLRSYYEKQEDRP